MNLKFFETMKKIYLYAVVLSTVFFACSTDALVEDYSATDMVYKTKTHSSLIDLITTLESACRGMTDVDTES